MALHARGGDRFRDVARALRRADKSMTSKLRKGINKAVPPLIAAVRREAPAYLPDAYAAVLGPALRHRTATSTSGAAVTVRVTVTAVGKTELRELADVNAGRLRHPLYGNRDHWFNQAVRPGVVIGPMADAAPAVRREIVAVVDEVLAEIERA